MHEKVFESIILSDPGTNCNVLKNEPCQVALWWLNNIPIVEADLDVPEAECFHLLLKDTFFLGFVLFWDYFNSQGLQRCSFHPLCRQ